MTDGADRIYQGMLLFADASGRPDLLEKVPGHSKFGDYFYKPVDIKSGSGFKDEDRGTLRDDYALQLYHYSDTELLSRGAFRLPCRGHGFLRPAGRKISGGCGSSVLSARSA